MNNAQSDPYFKKQIKYSYKNRDLVFNVGHTLFSTFEIDRGSDALLRSIKLKDKTPEKILDVGCGYGVVGISLAATLKDSAVFMADKDLLAVKFTDYNISENGIRNASVVASLGLDQIETRNFDLIVSNIPAKIGDIAIEQEFILKPLGFLAEKGELWVVVVSGLNRLIPKVAERNSVKCRQVKKRSGHTVYCIYQ
jgi:16S rRNA G1207 methylase RsmC